MSAYLSPHERLTLTGGEAFNAVASQLSNVQKAEFLVGAASVPDHEGLRLAALVTSGNYGQMHGLDQFPNQSLEDGVLKALIMGKIYFSEYATFHFTRGCMVGEASIDKICRVPLFEDSGHYSYTASSLIRQTSVPNTSKFHEGLGTLNQRKEARFIEFMRKVPASEQQFLIIPSTHSKEDCVKNMNLLQEVIVTKSVFIAYGASLFSVATAVQQAGLNIFHELADGRRMVPSFSMQQAFIYALYPEGTESQKVLQMTPVFGASSAEDVARGIRLNQRIYALFCSRLPTPPRADGFCAAPVEGPKALGPVIPYSDFSRHDLYHAALAAGITEELAEIVAFLGDELFCHKDNSYMNMIYNMVIDVEVYGKMAHCRAAFGSSEGVFWAGFCNVLQIMFRTAHLRESELYLQVPFLETLPQNVLTALRDLATMEGFRENNQDIALLSQIFGVIPRLAHMFLQQETAWNRLGIQLENFGFYRDRVKSSFPDSANPLIYFENWLARLKQEAASSKSLE